MNLPLRVVAEMLGLSIESDAMVTGWSVDSRTIGPGDLFFALRGPNHDGHKYAAEVLAKGAAGVVVDREVDAAGAVFRVEDSLKALQSLAARARERWGGEVIAVTGSAGKTSTKDLIAEMLACEIKTAKSEGNLNNHVGLPLSLLRMDEAARVMVTEIGMNHAGEIRELAAIAKPNIGVVTNVGYAHIEFFDSIDGIAAAKAELIEALDADGIAVLNSDDSRVAAFAQMHSGPVVFYGESAEANVRAEDVEQTAEGTLFRVGSTQFETRLSGHHAVSNILAAIAVAQIYGISTEKLREIAANSRPAKMRGETIHHHGILIYNDCYNSNPNAARAMIDVLRDSPARRRIAVLGEMLELGRWAEPLHRDVGTYAAKQGIDVLVGIRGATCCMLDAATSSGLRPSAAFFFDDPVVAGRMLRSLAQPGDAILFKGSRGVHVELALEEFLYRDRAFAEAEGSRN